MYPRSIKRIIDFSVALFAIVILLPFFLIVSFLLYYFQKSIFFTQDRPGLNGKVFKLVKFKTMNDKRDIDGKLMADAERLTLVGKIVRSTSLDELPQLFNVLIGDMSLIGPRPLLVRYLSLYSKEQARRHEVKPGITGWAQVNGRNTITWEKKFELDVWYVDHISFFLDLKILFLTVKKVFIREGISGGGSATMKPFTGNQKTQ